MIIKSIMTDEDRKALEYMLSLEYAMPYQLLKTKNNRRKIIYIMTPVLFLLSIGCYFVKSYPMFYVGMGISIIALIWIIWFQSKGKKFENNVHEFVWNKSRCFKWIGFSIPCNERIFRCNDAFFQSEQSIVYLVGGVWSNP